VWTGSWVNFYVSSDNVNWTQYIKIPCEDGSLVDHNYHDLTQYVAGSSKYYIKAELSGSCNAQLFREAPGNYADHFMSFDNQVTVIPEPGAVMAIVGMGLMLGLGILYRRRRNGR